MFIDRQELHIIKSFLIIIINFDAKTVDSRYNKCDHIPNDGNYFIFTGVRVWCNEMCKISQITNQNGYYFNTLSLVFIWNETCLQIRRKEIFSLFE